jgi:hypothetical protein
MKHRSYLGFLIVISVLVVAGGAGLTAQWQETVLLQGELNLARVETGELEQLHAENKRLRDGQIPAQQLEMLRADHMALPRLRAELEALKKRSS